MDPFTAIGLAGNIIAFIDFGFEVVSAAQEIYASKTGTTPENEHLDFLAGKVYSLVISLQNKKSTSQMTADERNLNDLAVECTRLSRDLLDMLKDLKARKAGSIKESLRALWRSIWMKKEKNELEKRLENAGSSCIFNGPGAGWEGDGWERRAELLDEEERKKLDKFVSLKLEQMKSRALAWEPDEIDGC
ncbi:hypothetical protein VTN77DRAFT_4726 [Rasamsonia byssochlamydoides]|uniref:uncharacterized protein n=1 Tax=Rasamsonia byssochlamydoides TaxID=89139 RepID=UPI003743B2D8